MSYKEEIMIMLEANTLHNSVEQVFEKALSHAKQTGQSLESIVYEIFEGVESCKKDEEALMKSVDIITQLLLQHAQDEMAYSYKKYLMASEAHEENIAKHYAFVYELFDTLKYYAKEHQYTKSLNTYKEKKSAHIKHMDKISAKVGYNHAFNTRNYHA